MIHSFTVTNTNIDSFSKFLHINKVQPENKIQILSFVENHQYKSFFKLLFRNV